MGKYNHHPSSCPPQYLVVLISFLISAHSRLWSYQTQSESSPGETFHSGLLRVRWMEGSCFIHRGKKLLPLTRRDGEKLEEAPLSPSAEAA